MVGGPFLLEIRELGHDFIGFDEVGLRNREMPPERGGSMEQRSDPRVSIKPPCRARFHVGGRSYSNVQVVNLGSHGCCVLIRNPTVNWFATGPVLESLQLIHPRLPKATIKAKVLWCRSQGRDNPGFMEAGVKFLDLPQTYSQELAQFLATPVQAS